MKKIYIVFVLLLCVLGVSAQSPGNRTAETIVADVLAQMPANNEADFKKQLSDLVSAGGDGVLSIVKMMTAPDKESNSALEYALSGLSSFVTEEGNENLQGKLENTYIEALDLVTEREVKAFIIRQLQIVGKDNSVDALGRFLNVEDLSGPAARALASIGSEKAGQALQASLLRRMGTPKTQRDVILAIGEAQLPINENLLKGMIGSGDEDFRKSVLYAISRTGTKIYLKEVEAAAEKAGFDFDKTGANEAYITLIKRVAGQGDIKEAEKAANDLLKKATKAGKTHTRNAALQILLSIQKEKGLKLVQSALKDPSKEYRNAALDFTSDFANKEIYIELVKTMAKAKPEVKVDILNWIGRESLCPEKNPVIKNLDIRFDLPARQVLLSQLSDKNYAVKEAAAWALVRIGDSAVIPVLAGLLTDADEKVVGLGKAALASFKGDVAPVVARLIPVASEAGKIAGLELLALRKASANINSVLEQTKSGSAGVKAAAYTALKDVVTDKDFTLLCGMLETAEASAVVPMQQAVIASVAAMPQMDQISTVSRRMLQAGESKKHIYYIVLASTKDREALDTLVKGFKEGTGEAKSAAFEALLNWKGAEVADELFAVCKDPSASSYFDRAIKAYIQLVSNPSLSGENRVIFLRKAMEMAQTDEQKGIILRQIGRAGTFLGMLYAGEFLDNKPLQQIAANAVRDIALNNKEYTGQLVRDLLNKVSNVLNNPDADYQREAIRKHLSEIPEGEGYASIFNGKDLTGWKGLVENPIKRAQMKPAQLAKAQEKADEQMRKDWKVSNGLLMFDGTGYDNLCTVKQYGDIEMYVDWMLDPAGPEADAGVYLRGTPQVQMWDTSRVKVGAQVGSGGLYNNQVHESKPLKVADNKLGEWNTMFIRMVGDRVTVYLNGELVTNDVILENFWNRKQPIFPIEQIELQAHGSKVYYRNLYVKELERQEPFKLSPEEAREGYKVLFDGTNMFEWIGNTKDYTSQDGTITLVPSQGSGGNLYTKSEYGNFIFRFEFMLTPAANNGLGIRTPIEGDAAYVGMELQILDNEHPVYSKLNENQYHGSVYGVLPAKRGFLKPVGEWNYQEVIANGDNIKITLNGEVILEGNIREASNNGTQTADKREHPGLLNKKGHIGFLGHGSVVKFKNIRIKELK